VIVTNIKGTKCPVEGLIKPIKLSPLPYFTFQISGIKFGE
jgi:hypothetical protein